MFLLLIKHLETILSKKYKLNKDFRPFPDILANRDEDFFKKEFEFWRTAGSIKIKKYISEKKGILKKIMRDKESYNLIAPMNSGKTYSLIKYALDNNIRMVMVMPIQVLVKQKIDEFEKMPAYKDKIISTHYKKEKDKLTPNLSPEDFYNKIENGVTVILAVYDSLPRIFHEYLYEENAYEDPDYFSFRDILNKFMLVVDEAHNLVTQYDFRYQAIGEVVYHRQFFKKVIYLTGTPEYAIYNNHKTLIYEQTAKKQPIKMRIVSYTHNAPYMIYTLLMSQEYKNKVIVIIDNISELIALQKMLVKNLFNNDFEKVKVLYSQNKNDEEFVHLIEHEEISENVQFILSTRVMSDGINIRNKNIDAVIFLDQDDLMLKRQFIARFRNGINGFVYDFYNIPTKPPPALIFPFNEYFQSRINAAEILTKSLNDFPFANNFEAKNIKEIKPSIIEIEGLGYSFSKGSFVPCPEGLGHHITKMYNKYIHKDILMMFLYYHFFCNYKVETHDEDSFYEIANPVISTKKYVAEKFMLMNNINIHNLGHFKANIIDVVAIMKPEIKKAEFIDPVIKGDISRLGASGHKVDFKSFPVEYKVALNHAEKMINDGFTKNLIEIVVDNMPENAPEEKDRKKLFYDNYFEKQSERIEQKINFEILRKFRIDEDLMKSENEFVDLRHIKKISGLLQPQKTIPYKNLMNLLKGYSKLKGRKNSSQKLKDAILEGLYDYHIYSNKKYITINSLITNDEFLKKISGKNEFSPINKATIEKAIERMTILKVKKLADKIASKYKSKKRDVPKKMRQFLEDVELRSEVLTNKEAIQKQLPNTL